MPSYKAPIRDMQFVLQEVWSVENLLNTCPNFAEISPDLIDAVLEEAAKINETLLQPLNQSGDQEGCQFDNGKVSTPKGFKEAYQTYQESGWPAIAADPNYGGQGFPQMVNTLNEEMLSSSNVSFSLYPGLTHAVANAIEQHATEELKNTYIPQLTSGEWTGVMCLTEPHCGSDLGLLRTKAESNDDGTYNISGTKIFITGGDHDLTDNIVHLVLARLTDAPAGVKGISLFLVSKHKLNEDNSIGERNHVSCGSIEHKMGIKASATCVINYDNAVGYLVGEPNRGLNAMFTVMNTERLAIGVEGLGLGEVAYQNALLYAKDRLQGRAPQGATHPEKSADPIIVHPNVRRMLLTMKAYNEAARAFAVWVGMHVDLEHHHPDAEQRQQAANFVALVTPIVKAYFTDVGLDVCNMGLQILGGHGYVSEWGMEQFVRDVRIAQIYEGTNGIQALDLVRRKLLANNGEHLAIFTEQVDKFINEQNNNNAMQEFIEPLNNALTTLRDVSQWLLDNAGKNPAEAGAASTEYLHLFGLTAFGFMWAKMAAIALNKIDGSAEKDFYTAKIHTARFFMQRLLPKVFSLKQIILTGSNTLMAMPEELF